MAQAAAHVEGQQHPIKLYLVVWGWLFVLSTCSYLVDYFGLHGYFRWSLILIFMVLKAGLIVAIFMHMAWERLALMYAILVRRRHNKNSTAASRWCIHSFIPTALPHSLRLLRPIPSAQSPTGVL